MAGAKKKNWTRDTTLSTLPLQLFLSPTLPHQFIKPADIGRCSDRLLFSFVSTDDKVSEIRAGIMAENISIKVLSNFIQLRLFCESKAN
jgi:hypothetical protein